METWRKVTTRSQVSVYRTNDTMVTIAAIDLKDETLPRWPSYPFRVKKEEKNSLCPVTVLVNSQVSDHCPWATCFHLFCKL